MRPSELKAAQSQRIETDEKLPPVSTSADPPITQEEARAAETAICRWHDGLIKSYPHGVLDGTVFYCPIGKQAWRFSKRVGAYYKPIGYSRKGIV